jgi:hypothetical protein
VNAFWIALVVLVAVERSLAFWRPVDDDQPTIGLPLGGDDGDEPLEIHQAHRLVVQGVEQAPPPTRRPPTRQPLMPFSNNSHMAYQQDFYTTHRAALSSQVNGSNFMLLFHGR